MHSHRAVCCDLGQWAVYGTLAGQCVMVSTCTLVRQASVLTVQVLTVPVPTVHCLVVSLRVLAGAGFLPCLTCSWAADGLVESCRVAWGSANWSYVCYGRCCALLIASRMEQCMWNSWVPADSNFHLSCSWGARVGPRSCCSSHVEHDTDANST
eukprot:1145561-Pelagomonas_calceolata.AAC.9